MKLGTVRIYAPEQWGSLEKFSRFYSGTHNLNESGKRAVSGSINHFLKGLTLKDLALKLAPNLEKDQAQLAELGYSHAINSKEFSAVIESAFLEFYSSVDCTRMVVSEIYSKYKGIPNSTRKYFKNIKDGNIDIRFPEQLILAVTEATWYDDFRKLRDELTHLDTGNCHKDSDTGKIRYTHYGLNFSGKTLTIDDIFQKLKQTASEINQFIERVFAYLSSQLNNNRIFQLCCIHQGRAYSRYVSHAEAFDFHGGICESRKWFDLEENPTCIFANECGAYKNPSN